MNVYAGRLSLLGTENAFKIGDDIARVERTGAKVIRLNLGEPDFNSAANINQAALESIQAGDSHYCDPQGTLDLRRSIAEHVSKTRSLNVSPDQVTVTSGGKPPIAFSMLTYVDEGDEVIYPNPGFPIYQSWISFLKAVPRPLALKETKGFRFDVADLEPLITRQTKLIIINSPSNPTGGVLTADDLARTAELLRAKAHPQFRVLSDEVYDHILFDGAVHLSIASLPGMAEHTIIMNSHSKTYAMTGWRVGYAVLPTAEEAKVFKTWNINTYSCTPPFIQAAARQALDDPQNQVVVAKMVEQFQVRRDAVVEALNRVDGFSCAKPAGAFYAFPNVGQACKNLGIMAECQRLEKEGRAPAPPSTVFQHFALYRHRVAAVDRAAFGTIDCRDEHYVRISLASDLDTLMEGVRRLADAATDRQGFREFAAQTDLCAL